MAKITGFTDDAVIEHLGDLFKYENSSTWYVSVACQPEQNKKNTLLSNLPLLTRGSHINSQKRHAIKPDRVIKFSKNQELSRCALSLFPDVYTSQANLSNERRQNAFSFVDEGQTVIVPQLELARAIFLIDSYLCRACLSSAELRLSFDVKPHPGGRHVDITVSKTSTFPKSAFEQSGTKKMLAWLLIDDKAMSSYESIFKHCVNEKRISSNRQSWNFSFEPPPLDGWELHVRGRTSRNKQYYLIEEIIGTKLNVNVPDSVTFINDDFIKREVDTNDPRSGSRGDKWQENTEQFEFDDQIQPSDKRERLVLEGRQSWISFNKPFDVNKRVRTETVPQYHEDDTSNWKGGRDVSSRESHQGGTIPAADIGGKTEGEDMDNQRQFAGRFKSFDFMIQVLSRKDDVKIVHQQSLALPQVGRGKSHLLADKSPRGIKIVHLHHGKTNAVLLEVDTSDGMKMLSTKVIFLSNTISWDEVLDQVCCGLVAKSIAWPNDIFDEKLGPENHIGISHPKHQDSKAGNLPLDSIESWAGRFMQAIS